MATQTQEVANQALMAIQTQGQMNLAQMTQLANIAERAEFDPLARAHNWDREHKTEIVAIAKALAMEIDLNDPNSLRGFGAGVLGAYEQTAVGMLRNTRLTQAALADDAFNDFMLKMRGVDLRKALRFPSWLAKISWLDPLRHTIRSMNSLYTELEAHKAEMRKQQRKITEFMTVYDDIDQQATVALPQLLAYAAALQIRLQQEQQTLDRLGRDAENRGFEAQQEYTRQNMRVIALRERQNRFVETTFRLWLTKNAVTNAYGIGYVTDSALSGLIEQTIPDLYTTFAVIIMQSHQSRVLDAMSSTQEVSREAMVTMLESLSRNTGKLRAYLLENEAGLDQYQRAVESITTTVEQVISMQKEFRQKADEFQKATGEMEQKLGQAITAAHQ